MNYELAKKLKDNGYPQEMERGDWWWSKEWNKWHLTLCLGECHPRPKEWIKAPTLEELIEACVFEISHLSRSPVMKEDGFHWNANGARGETPLEAVGNLWLKLNDKS